MGTIGYMAPEVITLRQYGPEADVFGAGVILYILLSGYPPFQGQGEKDILRLTARGQYSMAMPEWNNVSESAKMLVHGMLHVNPAQRWTVDDILDYPWLQC